MANKLLKHFGFSGKKVSSQQSPSREYPAKTSSSIHELHSRTPTKTRSSSNVVARGSSSSAASGAHVRPDSDARRHSDASAVRGSLPGARSAARSRPGGSPGVGWSLSRNDDDQSARQCDAATIASSSVRSRRPPRVESLTCDDTKKSHDHSDSSCSIRLEVTSVSAENLTPRILDEYSDPFDVKKEIEQSSKADDTVKSETQFLSATQGTPQASEDDYSVPYELKNVAGEEESEESGSGSPEAPVMPKYDDPYAEAPMRFRSLSAVEATRTDVEPTVLSSSLTDSVTSVGKVCPGLNGKESPGRISESSSSTVPELNGEGGSNTNNGSTTDIVQSSQADVDASATYDEPWDLRAARLGLENRLRAAQTCTQAASPVQHASTKYESRYKTMDPRPAMEYDEPWDRRAKDVQRSLISAKSAKEEARSRLLRERRGTPSHIPVFSSSTCRAPNASRNIDHSSSKQAGELPCMHLSSMMKHKCSSFDSTVQPWRMVAERIDPRLPLDQQAWYHGSISRLDAEALLRVHREGSYLVRMSESNRCDYSLSLKSPRGFMHMKIVSCDDGGSCGGGHYILGQFSQPFDSIPQMIHHYTINKLPIKGAEHMSLLHPVNHELL